MNEWQFNLGDIVRIANSQEQGAVIGRAQYLNAPASFLIRYVAADGRAVEAWWTGDALARA